MPNLIIGSIIALMNGGQLLQYGRVIAATGMANGEVWKSTKIV